MKKVIERILGFLAKAIIRKYKPFIIGLTGSFGKTSTKEAIALVLKKKFFLRASPKNYNNEIGLPLTIINALAPGKSLFGWLRIFLKGIFQIVFPVKFPKVLVLEMAADKPGDIRYLTKIAPCQIGLITAIGPVHLEKFKSLENIFNEKKIILTHLSSHDLAIFNADDQYLSRLKNQLKAKTLTFGFSSQADLRALEAKIDQEITEKGELKIYGLKFKVAYQGNVVPICLPKILAKHQIYSVLAALSVGLVKGLNLIEMAEILKEFEAPPGRMKLINGLKESYIIDDSYNSSPRAVLAALETLNEILTIPGRRKILVLGEMLELGSIAQQSHYEIGQKIADFNFDLLITVGQLAQKIAQGARENGFRDEMIFEFQKSEEAAQFLKEKINYGDLILIKGSQGVRMEKIVKEIMAEPERAKELLVRQDKRWKEMV
ncbi:MAG: UDP-N-acetylmuramoyl-tripeptide--D-alanyl-D-alanine ligase [Patescibacteria group bacterium]|nr:UDP-N-acetylmuramoyl-tripeptide--D-alanyl-D-alanine ligase [Patescibacteria group bacterium]